jgi:hypothetical protein
MNPEYNFDNSNHIHTLDGKPLHGVTTVLQVIAKPQLIQWSANVAVDYIKSKMPNTKLFTLTMGEMDQWLLEAKFAHRQKKEKAGDWGSEVHKAIEEWIKLKIEPKLEDTQKMVFDKFKEWIMVNKVEFLESEKHVYSREYWIGGILDLVFTMGGKKYIGDIKTSSGIYNEAFFQMGAYNICLEEMGEHKDIEGYVVINLKKDGAMDLKMADNMEINRQAFLSALSLYKIINSLK